MPHDHWGLKQNFTKEVLRKHIQLQNIRWKLPNEKNRFVNSINDIDHQLLLFSHRLHPHEMNGHVHNFKIFAWAGENVPSERFCAREELMCGYHLTCKPPISQLSAKSAGSAEREWADEALWYAAQDAGCTRGANKLRWRRGSAPAPPHGSQLIRG